ncbi:hypothetical protein LWF15_14485 [Kineosporia rhizophila]|uniref:hypothetical protein n=1 Tax=Kineosporia TaxID=49184 RepID=UPI001E2FDC65|nr:MULTISPECIES: hypothetical protein [Kineosporia]MCE0536712.1 hypothetical protein [Kineosporia rhizophila]GLY13140.1 hypothetical protein Kisp01_01560 [Kineosporia sp. NBRC 101677]
MSTTPPAPGDDKDGGTEVPTADLSELAATDALLDRLAARRPSDDDLLDPTAAALNRLLSDVDAESGADPATARLVEVLAGRPLYFDGPTALEVESLIDLTSPEQKSEKGNDDDLTAGPAEILPTPITAARSKRWRVAAGKVSAPVAAASIAVMVLLGGGVSAAVAGDPLAPLNGVGSVVAKLPGVDRSDPNDSKLQQAQAELALAQELAVSDPEQAAQHLNTARKMLAELPDDETADLDQQVETLATQLPGDPDDPSVPGATTVAATSTPDVTPTGEGPVTASPSAPPTTTPTGAPTTSGGGSGGENEPSAPPSSTTDEPAPPTSTSHSVTTPASEPTSSGSGSSGGQTDPPATNTGSSSGGSSDTSPAQASSAD